MADLSMLAMMELDRAPASARDMDARYRESQYLLAFPDVAAAVACGALGSGLAHYLATGRDEMLSGRRSMEGFVSRSRADLPENGDADADRAGTACRLDFGTAAAEFDLALYLALFPDVEAAVAAQSLDGAFGHWLEDGFAEMALGHRRICFARPAVASALAPALAPGADQPRQRRRDFTHLLSRPFGVTLFGPLAMETGLGSIARGTLAALQAAGVPVDAWPYDTSEGWRVLARPARPCRFRVNLLLVNAETMGNLLGAFPAGTFDDAYNVALWQWELASMPPEVVQALGSVDEIWTSSSFERDAIAAVVPVPVRVVPPTLRVRPSMVQEPWPLPSGIDRDAFLFVAVLDLASRLERKNAAAAIEAFAMLDEPGAALLLKVQGSEPNPANDAVLQGIAARHPRVAVLHESLTETEMAWMRRRADCLVSPHRSEGFGLNLAEFMALGKPVVATGYSGSTDFLDESVGYPVDHDLVELPAAIPPYPAGYVWAAPRITSLVARMREVMTDPAGRQRRGEAAAARMAERHTPAAAGAVMAARLHELGLDAPLPPFMAQADRTGRVLGLRAMMPGGAAHGVTAGPGTGSGTGPVFSIPLLVRSRSAVAPSLAALLDRPGGQAEILLRLAPHAEPEAAAWLGEIAGSSPFLRVLWPGGPGFVEAATAPFILFAPGDAAPEAAAVAALAAALAAEPALDGAAGGAGGGPGGGDGLLAVRKSLLLEMGEPDLDPGRALGTAFARRLATRSRLVRRLD